MSTPSNIKNKSDLQKAILLCKGAFISAAGFSFFINMLMLVPAIYMLQVYDRVVSSGSKSTLLMLTLIVVFLFITLGGLEWVRSQILVKVSTKLEALLSARLFRVAFDLSLNSGGQRASSQPLDDLTSLRQFMTGNGLFAFFDAPWMPIYVAVMFLFHPWFGVMAIVTAAILGVIAVLSDKLTGDFLAEANSLSVTGRALVNRNLQNAEVIESMGMLKDVQHRWMKGANDVLSLQAEASSRSALLTSMSKTIRLSAQSLILGLGAFLVIEQQISPGMMIAGSILLGRALAPIDQMIGAWKGFVSARTQYHRLNELLIKVPAERETMSLPAPRGHLKVENAVVAPPGSMVPVVKGVNFEVLAGNAVGIIGPSGAGKSTLARAILGIWPSAGGKIRLDGADIYAWDRHQLGPYIGYLPQDVELFEGSISENIGRFGKVDPDKVVAACKAADVHEMVLRLPEGYNTIIGASGGTLSGGQRQRIGLARAMYGNPSLVVLDEPNSNLDDLGEIALAKAIQNLKRDKVTVIVISHRTSVLSVLDKLLVMKEGQGILYGETNQVLAQLKKNSARAQAAVVPVAGSKTPH